MRCAAPVEEAADLPTEALDVDEERVVSLDAVEWPEERHHTGLSQLARNRALLGDREQHVRLDTDHQCLLELRPSQDGLVVAVLAQVEAIHCT